MESLHNYIASKISLTQDDLIILNQIFIPFSYPASTQLISAGKMEKYLYYLKSGIVKGYQIKNGKMVVDHLISKSNFFTSLDSFMNEVSGLDFFETITDCEVFRISRHDFSILKESGEKWRLFIDGIINESLQCKMERIQDFQTLTAKERYLKILKTAPEITLNTPIATLASFLGMEPQSLSRIRKQVIM